MSPEKANEKRSRRIIKWLWVLAISPFALLATMLTLAASGVFGRMPSFEELENPKSNLATEVYADNGEAIGSFFVQNRSYVQYDELFPQDSTKIMTIAGRQVPPLAAVLIATEDARFYSHSGIDFMSLMRVAVKTIALRHSSQGGGSTITQQLAKNLFPRGERGDNKIVRTAKLVVAKLKEWITAVKLEYNYTKEEIVAMYLNVVEYGSNSFGIKSAAATFFGKEPSELNLQEAAMLVGVVNAPTRYSPVRNPKSALNRRNTVLRRIEAAGCISKEECDSLTQLPIILNYKPISHNYGTATYFREMLRLTMTADRPKRRNFYNTWDYEQACKEYEENPLIGWCHKNRKADGTPYDIYRDGLKIYTTINATMQKYAEDAVQKQLQNTVQPAMDRQVRASGRLFRGASKKNIESIMRRAIRQSDRYYHMKEDGYSEEQILASFDKECKMKIFTFRGERDTILTPRDSILHHKRIMRASLVAIEPQTGHLKAYVGGPSFQYFKYDVAKQGKRQVGSIVKPFVYTFAIDHLGLTPCTMVPNLPVTIEMSGRSWSPKEAGKVSYDGTSHPLRWGLTYSRNNYSAWIMKQTRQPAAVADFLHNMGIKSYISPVYSLCVGSFESNVYEMVSAFATFANEGVYTAPMFVTHIEDRHGNVISTFSTSSHDAISKRTAYTMIDMMKGVIQSGTGSRMIWNFGMRGVELAGKTGTTNENRDGWFMCVAPKLVAGAWVGGEDKYVHLAYRGEGAVVALPIVGQFLRSVYDDPSLDVKSTDKFKRPARWFRHNCPNAVAPVTTEGEPVDEFFE